MTNIQIDEKRVQAHLDEIALIGRDPKGGFTRLALSPEEQATHDYAKSIFQVEGYTIRTDAFGNLIASKEGKNPSSKRVMLGTHLDTVPNGGNYDGVVGFITAVEAVKSAESVNGRLGYGIDIIIFRAEESSRFNRACLGSSAAFGFMNEQDLQLVDKGGTTLEQMLRTQNFEPSGVNHPTFDLGNYQAYFETHIEQASVLEREGVPVGIVTSIRAPVRFKVDVKGNNTVYTVSRMINEIRDIATFFEAQGDDIVATVGRVDGYFSVSPNAMNVVPSEVTFTMPRYDAMFDKALNNSTNLFGLKYASEVCPEGIKYTVFGEASHSGGTPMGNMLKQHRRDALTAATRAIEADRTMIPYTDPITFYIDFRSNNLELRDYLSQGMKERFDKISTQAGTTYDLKQTEYSKPQLMNEALQQVLRDSANELGIQVIDLPSGAGHDAMKAAQAGIPTAMLFVPSRKGLSHNPDEFTDNKYIARATGVLANALLHLQRQ